MNTAFELGFVFRTGGILPVSTPHPSRYCFSCDSATANAIFWFSRGPMLVYM